jgi:putative DNA methylase
MWVKVETCPMCGTDNDLFPGYLLAEDVRHPANFVVCATCGELNESATVPTRANPQSCQHCGERVHIDGPAKRLQITCRSCQSLFRYPRQRPSVPRHRMWAIEYQCARCKPAWTGRFFKTPDAEDLALVEAVTATLSDAESRLTIPDDPILAGDETDRLHRWGYRRFRDMFNERQLLGLGLLLEERAEQDAESRHALLTVFSDFLRYQNMLCRYDTYALKCQDIFSVHGFPVGLIQCENNILGVPRVGSGSFRHFVEKYRRAKAYCARPFETRLHTGRKQVVYVDGDRIQANVVERFPSGRRPEALLAAKPAAELPLEVESLDGVFTDPLYFDNVQYAELMDFCYAWLRQALAAEVPEFAAESTRSPAELTGNTTAGRDLANFTEGLAAVFRHYAGALKPGAPFVFTYHHNDASAYVPLVAAILDAGLDCTATLPAPAEMGASLHISGTGSSIIDSVFVCRRGATRRQAGSLAVLVAADVEALRRGGLRELRVAA